MLPSKGNKDFPPEICPYINDKILKPKIQENVLFKQNTNVQRQVKV